MEVINKISIYEINGNETKFGSEHLKIISHWNNEDKVVISLDDGLRNITVSARELIAAISNATNTAKGLL